MTTEKLTTKRQELERRLNDANSQIEWMLNHRMQLVGAINLIDELLTEPEPAVITQPAEG